MGPFPLDLSAHDQYRDCANRSAGCLLTQPVRPLNAVDESADRRLRSVSRLFVTSRSASIRFALDRRGQDVAICGPGISCSKPKTAASGKATRIASHGIEATASQVRAQTQLLDQRAFGLIKDRFRPLRLVQAMLGQRQQQARQPLGNEDASIEESKLAHRVSMNSSATDRSSA